MATEPNWTEEELALHVAYEQCPQLRARYPSFAQAMAEPAVAKALTLSARARLRTARTAATDEDETDDSYWPAWQSRRR